METNQEQPVDAQPAVSDVALPGENREPRHHSGPGIASFVLSIVMYLLMIAAVVFAVNAVGGAVHNGTIDQDFLQSSIGTFMIIGFAMIASGTGLIIALVLGIVGLAQKQRLKAFAVIGTVLSALAVLLLFGLLILGVFFAGGRTVA